MTSTSQLQLRSLHEELLAEKPTTTQNGSQEQTILDRMARFRQNSFNFAHELYLFIRGVGWRSYDRIVGQPVFYSGYTPKIKNAVMASPLLSKRLEELTEARLKREEQESLLDTSSKTYAQDRANRKLEISESLRELSAQMVDRMMCKMESKVQIRSRCRRSRRRPVRRPCRRTARPRWRGPRCRVASRLPPL